MTLLEFPAKMIEKFGIHNVNPVIEHFASTEPAYIASFPRSTHQGRLAYRDLGLNEGAFYDPDSNQRQKGIDDARKESMLPWRLAPQRPAACGRAARRPYQC